MINRVFKGSLTYRLMNTLPTGPTRTFGFQFRSFETVCFPLPLFVHRSIFMLNWSTWTCVQHLRSSNIIAFPHLQQPGQRWIPVPCGRLWSPIWTNFFHSEGIKPTKKSVILKMQPGHGTCSHFPLARAPTTSSAHVFKQAEGSTSVCICKCCFTEYLSLQDLCVTWSVFIFMKSLVKSLS